MTQETEEFQFTTFHSTCDPRRPGFCQHPCQFLKKDPVCLIPKPVALATESQYWYWPGWGHGGCPTPRARVRRAFSFQSQTEKEQGVISQTDGRQTKITEHIQLLPLHKILMDWFWSWKEPLKSAPSDLCLLVLHCSMIPSLPRGLDLVTHF